MKKLLLSLSIICVLALGLCACDDTENENKNKVEPTPASQISSPTKNANEEKIEKETESGEENIVVSETTPEPTQEVELTKEPEKKESSSEYTVIKFSDMYETKGKNKNVSTMLKNLNGKKVEIKGYPAVQSPLDESFVYLNNQPYVTCPFCTIGDVTKLEVIPIFMANKSKIKYTENALDVFGTLEIAAKVDSEGYTTQFRIYADKVTEITDSNANKLVNEYYSKLSQAGMIYDIQTLQMNVEYASNPEYMIYYDEDLQTGKSKTLSKVNAIKGIVDEYLGFDSQYGGYLRYIEECPDIVKSIEPEDERLKGLNDELIQLYNDEIEILKKYEAAVYEYQAIENPTAADAEKTFKALTTLNVDNLKQYNAFTAWNNKLRE